MMNRSLIFFLLLQTISLYASNEETISKRVSKERKHRYAFLTGVNFTIADIEFLFQKDDPDISGAELKYNPNLPLVSFSKFYYDDFSIGTSFDFGRSPFYREEDPPTTYTDLSFDYNFDHILLSGLYKDYHGFSMTDNSLQDFNQQTYGYAPDLRLIQYGVRATYHFNKIRISDVMDYADEDVFTNSNTLIRLGYTKTRLSADGSIIPVSLNATFPQLESVREITTDALHIGYGFKENTKFKTYFVTTTVMLEFGAQALKRLYDDGRETETFKPVINLVGDAFFGKQHKALLYGARINAEYLMMPIEGDLTFRTYYITPSFFAGMTF
jgi:hypothetical protein